MRHREIVSEMNALLKRPGAGEKAIEALPYDHPIRREYVKIKNQIRKKELREHKKIREAVRNAKHNS